MSEDRSVVREKSWGAVTRAGLLLVCLVPLVHASGMLFPYITPKGVFFQGLVGTCSAVALWVAGTRVTRLEDFGDPVLWSLAAFVGVGVVSALFGPATHESVFGDYERMWGLVQWLSLLLLYTLLRALFTRSDWRVFLRCTLYVAVAVALYAGIEFYLSNLVVPTRATSSTLGNPGYLGAYLVLALGTAIVVVGRYEDRFRARTAAAVAVVLFVGAILLSGNRSSLIGLSVGTGTVLLLVVAAHTRRIDIDLRWMWGGVATCVLAAAVVIFAVPEVVSRIPVMARLADVGPTSNNLLQRFEMWEAALEGFRERPLTGWGMEQFPLVYDRFVDPAAYRAGSFRADRAHNVILGKLVHSGLLGLIAYLAFWGSLVTQTLRGWMEERLGTVEAAGLLVAFIGYFVFLQMWFEDHASAALLVALAAYLRHRCTDGARLLRIDGLREWSRGHVVAWAGVCVVAFGLTVWHVGRSGAGAHLMYEAVASPDLESRIDHYERARRLDVPQHHEVALRYAVAMGGIGRSAGAFLERSDSLRGLYRRGVGGAEQALNRAGVRNPLNGRIDAARGRLTAGAGVVYPGEEVRGLARQSFEQAIDKSPPILAYRHRLAITHGLFDDRNAGRQALRDALDVYDGFGRTYYLLAQMEGGEIGDTGLRRLRQAFWLGYRPEDRSRLRRAVISLLSRNRPEEAEQLLSVYFASHYLPALRAMADHPYRQERRRFFGSLDADVASPGMEYRGYEIQPDDLTLLARWPRAAMAAGECRRATLAVRLLMNGLSERSGTARIRPTLARQSVRIRKECSAPAREASRVDGDSGGA